MENFYTEKRFQFLVFTCEICRNIFAPALYIRKHIATHRGGSYLECELWRNTFHHANVLINHIGNHLGGSLFSNQKMLRHAVFMDRWKRFYKMLFSFYKLTLFSRGTYTSLDFGSDCVLCRTKFNPAGILKRHILGTMGSDTLFGVLIVINFVTRSLHLVFLKGTCLTNWCQTFLGGISCDKCRNTFTSVWIF